MAECTTCTIYAEPIGVEAKCTTINKIAHGCTTSVIYKKCAEYIRMTNIAIRCATETVKTANSWWGAI